jgi:hypothetical protein
MRRLYSRRRESEQQVNASFDITVLGTALANMSAAVIERKRLPNRRGHQVGEFAHNDFRYVGGVGRFDHSKIAEVFLNAAKTDTAVEATARDAVIVGSLALQHGVHPEAIQHAVTHNADGSALGKLLDILLSAEMP